MKLLLVLFGFLSLDCSAAYHRLYRGFTTLAPETFIKVVNKDFFPLFSKAAPLGLISYRPALLNVPTLPNEIVLLTFKDEETYKAYTNTEIGKNIRAAHGPVFDSTKSNSLVPGLYSGKAAVENTYLLDPNFTNTIDGVVGVLILSEPYGSESSSLEEVEKVLSAGQGLKVMSLIAKNYLIEYLFADSPKALEKLRSDRCSGYKKVFKANKFIPLEKHKIGDKVVGFEQGMDAQW
ncbi:MAG: hypothetical protein K2P81_06040 [Bacteriovoracaceae bacterium]|nr:hypothetical protein [Bacteriovoracaceae bacterium]